ncbi:MAG: response regulator [Sphingomonas taxi]
MVARAMPLLGRRILVIEDEYMIADDLATALRVDGAEVIGPVASLGQGMQLMAQGGPFDAAVLDINLRGTLAYPLLDRLIAADVPVLLSTGYDAGMIPERYRHLPRCDKPVSAARLLQAVACLWNPLPMPRAPMPPAR